MTMSQGANARVCTGMSMRASIGNGCGDGLAACTIATLLASCPLTINPSVATTAQRVIMATTIYLLLRDGLAQASRDVDSLRDDHLVVDRVGLGLGLDLYLQLGFR